MNSISGEVNSVVFQNKTNGYTVCTVLCDDDIVTAVGIMPGLCAGEFVSLIGKWTTHASYGKQYQVNSFQRKPPSTRLAIQSYLASGAIKGIGARTAARLVAAFGEDTLNVIEREHRRLSSITGITASKAKSIHANYMSVLKMQSLVMLLQPWGVSAMTANKLFRELGESANELISKNPYLMLTYVPSLGFSTVDRFAMTVGVSRNSQERITAAVLHVLYTAAYSRGHTYLPRNILLTYTGQLCSVTDAEVENVLTKLLLEKKLVNEKIEKYEAIYPVRYFNAEMIVAKRLISLECIKACAFRDIDKKIKKVSKKNGIILSELQRKACSLAMQHNVCVITGGPGTGKTTVINILIQLLEQEGLSITLAAPTGIAAKRITEVSGREAKTIHRLLEIEFGGDDEQMTFGRNESLPLDSDVVIVDEMSMVDIMLMQSLVKSLKPGTKLIMCGDVDQLPSVGAGNVLSDIINSKAFEAVVCLTDIYRQESQSMIVINAHRINSGKLPVLNAENSDFFFVPVADSVKCLSTLIYSVKTRLSQKYGYDFINDIQVISPTKKGDLGTVNINQVMQAQLNPGKQGAPEMKHGKTIFRKGDKVMQIKNNYEAAWTIGTDDGVGVFNGDIGIITAVSQKGDALKVRFNDERVSEYPQSRLEELEHAYCITVHKSQGSEFPVVVMPMMPCAPMLMVRNLFYTAITRAREKVILIGHQDVVERMVNDNTKKLRYSGLSRKLIPHI